MTKSIVSYNVNGIRAAARAGFYDWLQELSPDVICLQETKAHSEQLDAFMLNPPGYESWWFSAEKKGYSGVAVFSKEKPLRVTYGFGDPSMEAYDREGRALRLDFENFSVMSLYVPSGSSGPERQAVKDAFMEDYLRYSEGLLKHCPRLIVAGDYNVAHTETDIHDPVGNKKSSGFLPHEREWMSHLLASGYQDVFRRLHPDARDQYSWWSFRAGSRNRNKGWRIDYHLISDALSPLCVSADLMMDVKHSDHCPIRVVMEL